jgi:hypothetical protein
MRAPWRVNARQKRLAGLRDDERLLSLARVGHYIAVWRQALHDQAQRIDAAGIFKGSSEKWLWASALGGLLRTVDLAGDLGADIKSAKDAFTATTPDAKSLRDVLTHLEDYELGVGRLPSVGQLEMLHEQSLRVIDGELQLEHTTIFQGVQIEVNFRTAQAAAELLAASALEAVERTKAVLIASGAEYPPVDPRPDLAAIRAHRGQAPAEDEGDR